MISLDVGINTISNIHCSAHCSCSLLVAKLTTGTKEYKLIFEDGN